MPAENLEGKKFGNLTVIGDTGKRNKNGMQIVIVRDDEGNLHEYLASNVKNGIATGFRNSRRNIENGKSGVRKMHKQTIRNGNAIKSLCTNVPNYVNKTGYKGVFYDSHHKKWVVQIKVKNTKKHTRYFNDFEQAVYYSKKMRSEYILPLLNEKEKDIFLKTENKNIKINDYTKDKQMIIDRRIKEEKRRLISRKIKSYQKSKGVLFEKNRSKWIARIKINGKEKTLGRFNTEQEAIQAREKAVDEQIKKLKEEMERL